MNIKKVLVVGSGTLGQQIGFQCAVHGFETIMYDQSQESLDACRANHRQYAELFTSQRRKSQAEIDEGVARLSYTTDLAEAGRDADLVSECVPEDPEIKRQVFASLHQSCPARTVFTTNTSTLLPSQLADATGRPDRFLALHFANEIWERNIAEIMAHPGTDPEILEHVVTFAKAIGMVPIRLEIEQSGYVINSLLVPWLMAAQALVVNGIASAKDVDRTWMIATKMQLGPFGMLDIVGLETAYNIASYWGEVNGDEQFKKNADYLKTNYVDHGKLGVKTGEGYYKHPSPEYAQPGFLV
ncbi:3-hydroxyacyl-CoA dehydrogenase [Nocardia sp. NPDC004278]